MIYIDKVLNLNLAVGELRNILESEIQVRALMLLNLRTIPKHLPVKPSKFTSSQKPQSENHKTSVDNL